MSRLLVLRVVLAAGLLSAPAIAQTIPSVERQALIELFASTEGYGWQRNDGWLSEDGQAFGAVGTECGWDGVVCNDANDAVRRLELRSNDLRGELPEGLVRFSELEQLDVGSNRLVGRLPESIGRLRKLELVFADGNSLTGSIPTSIGEMTELRTLDLSSNLLSGAIPDAIGEISALEVLVLSDNRLSGPVPSAIGNLENLEALMLRGNRLQGSIPDEIGNALNLFGVDIAHNQLSGVIPAAIGRLERLETLDLSGNQLTSRRVGDSYVMLPDEFRNLRALASLNLSDNALTGHLPPVLRSLGSLEVLVLAHNRLSGRIDDTIESLESLVHVDLSHNAFTGELPTGEREGPRDIFHFDVSHNELTGRIALESFEWAVHLDLSSNELAGELPATLENLEHVEYLDFSNNRLVGPLIPEVAALTDLVTLRVSDNGLFGPLPDGLEDLVELSHLDLSGNRLEGGVPASLSRMPSLRRIDLSGNPLGGPLPDQWEEAELQELRLSDCALEGRLPAGLFELNRLVWLDLNGNGLQGSIPSEIAAASMLQILQLAGNALSGELPSELASLSYLAWLDVSGNRLTGDPRDVLQALASLQALDLSGNDFSSLPEPPLSTLPSALGRYYEPLYSPTPGVGEPVSAPHAIVQIRAPRVALVRSPAAVALLASRLQPTGRLEVSVVDENGDVLPGVSITITSSAGGTTSIGITGVTGTVVFANLEPGDYSVSAELAGFQVVRSEVQVGLQQSASVSLTMSTGVTEIIRVNAELPRVDSVVWNSWVLSLDNDVEPVSSLEEGESYRFFLDLSRFEYGRFWRGANSRATSSEFSAMLTPNARALVRFIVVGDAVRKLDVQPASVWTHQGWTAVASGEPIIFDINFAKLLNEVGEAAPPYHEFADHTRAAGAGLRVRAVERGCAVITASVWDEEGRLPLDHVVHHVAVGDPRACGDEPASGSIPKGLLGMLSLDDREAPDAALHVFELKLGAARRSIALFVPNPSETAGAPDALQRGSEARNDDRQDDENASHQCDYYSWELRDSMSQLLDDDVFRGLIKQARERPPFYQQVADILRDDLFPPDALACGATEAFAALRGLASEPRRELYARLVGIYDENLYLPLGLLFLLESEEELLFPETVTVSQPLPRESYRVDTCVSDWRFVIPSEYDHERDETVLKLHNVFYDEVPDQLAVSEEESGEDSQILRNRTRFKNFADIDHDAPTGMVLLAHHRGRGYLYFQDHNDFWKHNSLGKFKTGSIAVLATCSAGNFERSPHLLNTFNEQGFDALILSPFDIQTKFGVGFALNFSVLVRRKLNEGASVTLRELFEEAMDATIAAESDRKAARGMAAQIVLAGNGDLKLCQPQ